MNSTPQFELIVTTGDPQGIGPEISWVAAQRLCERYPSLSCTVVASSHHIPAGMPLLDGLSSAPVKGLRALKIPTEALPEEPGPWPEAPSAFGGKIALEALRLGYARTAADPEHRALVTAPLSKEAVTQTGQPFSGHTQWLGDQCGVDSPMMLFVAPGLKVALATVHVPLSQVSSIITEAYLKRCVLSLREGLQTQYGISEPRIAVLATNPHAGEGGLLGDDEIRVHRPAIAQLKTLGIEVEGPFSADSFFRPERLALHDGVLAMYHDQGLLPIKALAFGKAVNVTLGLPLIRTSVDHGCAFDLKASGNGSPDPSSMVVAMEHALELLELKSRPSSA